MIDVIQIPTTRFTLLSYILKDQETGEALVIDPPKEIGRWLERETLNILAVINTHTHPDHTQGNLFFHGGIPILAHPAEKSFMLRAINSIYTLLSSRKTQPKIDFSLNEGNHLSLGDTTIEVIHTPGHSPGSVCLYWPGNLIAGDTVFAVGIGRSDIPGGNNTMMKQSLERILELPEDTLLWPGHFYDEKYCARLRDSRRTIVWCMNNLL
ncbi:MAG: MBL fold metallo-hydrolase [Deltaproteobacteria bacterium]|nr:MBL fold metallo-hydrolase [Deltaproteobacteria bacterium]